MIQDAVPRLGHRHRRYETNLAHLLLEDMNGIGLAPVSIVETAIAISRSRLYFVFEASYRAHISHPVNKHCIFSYLSYQYIWLKEITGYRFTGKK